MGASFREMKAKWANPDLVREEREFRDFLRRQYAEDFENKQIVNKAIREGRWVEPASVPPVAWHYTGRGDRILGSGEIHFGGDTDDAARRKLFHACTPKL